MTDNNLNQVPESFQEEGEVQVESQVVTTNDAIAENFSEKTDINPVDLSMYLEDYAEAAPSLQDKKAQRRIEETEVLENMNELQPIQTGTLTAYNPELKKWVIASNTSRATYDVYFDNEDNLPNVWDSVNYVKVKTVAFLTSVGQVKKVVEKTPTEDDETSSIIFVTPHDNSKTDVALKTGQNDFSEEETVEFVANKADRIIAIQKK